jgi:hypothetical protein
MNEIDVSSANVTSGFSEIDVYFKDKCAPLTQISYKI